MWLSRSGLVDLCQQHLTSKCHVWFRPKLLTWLLSSYDLAFPIECDYEYWENEDPELCFKQPEGKASVVTAWIKYLQLVEWMAFTHRTVVGNAFPLTLEP